MRKSIPSRPAALTRWTTTTALGAVSWVITSSLAGCAPDNASEAAEGEGQKTHNEGEGHAEGEDEGQRAHSDGALEGEGEGASHVAAAGAEGEAEGEGASEGEGEGAGAGADVATDDVAYLTKLGLIRGHLTVGYALYERGMLDLAQTHVKHPKAEIYTAIEPAFAARGCRGFGAGLSGLTEAVVEQFPLENVLAAYEELNAAIATCERAASVDDPKVLAKVIEDLLRTAGVEYKIGVVEGKMNNLHEYQDAWGFTQVAAKWATAGAFSGSADTASVAAQMQSIIHDLDPLWPSLNPGDAVDGDAARLFGAAGQISVAAAALGRP